MKISALTRYNESNNVSGKSSNVYSGRISYKSYHIKMYAENIFNSNILIDVQINYRVSSLSTTRVAF